MTLIYSPLFFPLLTFLFSFFGTWTALTMLTQYAVLDNPNARSNHKAPVPRGGGIAMVIFALIFLYNANLDPRIIIGAGVLAAISFIDDLRGLPAALRLVAQLVAVTIAMSAFPLPLIAQIIIGFAWLWFVNLFNFMDGIDGITSMETLAITFGILAVAIVTGSLPFTLSLQTSILAASVLGFYWFNRHPAKLFMGDVGSTTLGFLLFALLLALALHGQLIPALILPAYYMGDATNTLLRRALRREKIWQAHSEHAYQKAVRKGLSHIQVVHKITALNFCLVVLAIFATLDIMVGIVMLVAAYALVACMIRHLSNRYIL